MSRSPPLPYLPLDCVLEIASHAPAATRAAMAGVCRDWKAALDGPSFAWHTLNLPEMPPLHGFRQEFMANGHRLWPLPPLLAACLPAVRALTVGFEPFSYGHIGATWVNPSHVPPLLSAASGLTSLHVTVASPFVASVVADVAAACPGLAALSISVASYYGEARVREWADLETLTALTRLSRLRVAVTRRGPADALPRLPALRSLTLELYACFVSDAPEFPVPTWLANNATTRLASLDLHVQVQRHVPGNVLPDVPDSLRVTRLRVTGPDPSAGMAPWLASMTRLVDLEWQCEPVMRWADTVDTVGRLEAIAPRLTRLILAGWPAHAIRFPQVPMPHLRVLQFRGFRPRLRGLMLPPITAAAPALRVLMIGLRHDVPAERRVIDVAPLLAARGLRELRILVLERTAVTASKPAQPGDAARRAFPNLRALHVHDCVAADVRGQQVLAALREEADRTCFGPCPLDFRLEGWGETGAWPPPPPPQWRV